MRVEFPVITGVSRATAGRAVPPSASIIPPGDAHFAVCAVAKLLASLAVLGIFAGIFSAAASASAPHRPRIVSSCSAGHVTFRTAARGKLYVRRGGKLVAHRHSHRVTVWSGGKRVTVRLRLVKHGTSVVRARTSRVCPRPVAPKPATKITPVQRDYCPTGGFGAHRGEDWPHPTAEDSRQAVAAALADPRASFVESDVWATSDGQGLMQHSDRLAEASNGTGLVSDYTLAELQANVKMDDGTVPESLPEYLAQVVAARKHAILHFKSPSLREYVDAVMRTAGAHPYVRIMVSTFDDAEWFLARGWEVELGAAGVPSAATVARAKAYRLQIMVVNYSHPDSATPPSWFEPFMAAGVPVDYVTYSAAQDAQIRDFPFARVLSGNIAHSISASGCR